jgi:two-component system sensor histidine kinase MtrB
LLALEHGVIADLVWEDAVQTELCARLSARLRDVVDSRNRAARARCFRLVAHDINSPLTVIGVLAELLKDELEGEALTDLASMVESADMASMVVESMNNLARIESPDTDTASGTVVDLAAIARRVMARPALRNHIRGTLADDMMVFADAGALERALIDLFVNARAMADPKTTLLVYGESDARRHTVYLAIRGQGMPTELRDRAFEPFGSAELRAKRVPLAAVGLAYAARVARGHGGTVSFDDTSGGVLLRLDLPVTVR